MSREYKIRQSKEGKVMRSNTTGNTYLVHKWREYGDGRVLALEKELIKKGEDEK